MTTHMRRSVLLAVIVAGLLVACSQEAASPAPARTLPNENVQATISWGFLCSAGADPSPTALGGITRWSRSARRGAIW